MELHAGSRFPPEWPGQLLLSAGQRWGLVSVVALVVSGISEFGDSLPKPVALSATALRERALPWVRCERYPSEATIARVTRSSTASRTFPDPTSNSRGRLNPWVIVCLAVLFIIALSIAVTEASARIPNDFLVYRAGAQVLLDGGSLYTDVNIGKRPLQFTYPPFAAVLMIPFTLLPLEIARIVWAAILIASLLVICAITARQLPSLSAGRLNWPW